MAETIKAKPRREREGFFDKYIKLPGIDIGCGSDPVHEDFDKWDYVLGHGDATYMNSVADNWYKTVYNSHIIEHLNDPITAIQNWFRILQPDGYLIIFGPHRDLYEKQKLLPSRWNPDHKTYWLPFDYEPPCTFSLQDVIHKSLKGLKYTLVQCKTCDEDWHPVPFDVHSHGEYSIEAIVKKNE